MISSACLRFLRSIIGDGGSAVSAGSRYERWRASSATITVSRTVNPLKLRAFWNARPIPWRARRYDGHAVDPAAEHLDSPDDFTNPEIAFMSVVLPAPFVPMRPTTSPGRTSIETPADRERARRSGPARRG